MTQNSTDFVRPLLVVLAALVLVPALMMAFMMPMMGMWGSGHMTDGWMWGGTGGGWVWLGMWLVMLLVIGGIGYLVYTGTRRTGDRESDSAVEELRHAYARGDLSDEEFERRRERLRREE
ncbi:MAG: putative membrane protein [Haloarculaceae archaeon]|jgi:putative membrane protein